MTNRLYHLRILRHWGGTFTRWLLTEEGEVIARRRREFQYHPQPAPVVRLRPVA